MSAEKLPVDAGLNETSEKFFEELPEETQDRIMGLCERAGMPVDWMEVLRKILKDPNNPKLPESSLGQHGIAVLQGVRDDIERM